jgi:hypothetical protein
MYFSTMVDMANTPDEVKKDVPCTIGDTPPKGPLYPWGLCIRLQTDDLKKLGLGDEMPSVGEMIHLCAMAKVTSVSQNEMEDTTGGKSVNRCVELQITHLATENEDEQGAAAEEAVQKTAARQSRFYGPEKTA